MCLLEYENESWNATAAAGAQRLQAGRRQQRPCCLGEGTIARGGEVGEFVMCLRALHARELLHAQRSEVVAGVTLIVPVKIRRLRGSLQLVTLAVE
ncbi:MAG: hypothetical protein ACK55I_07670 [bacterium]